MPCILYLLPFLFFFVDACPNGTQVSSVNKSICYDVRESAKGHSWYAAEYQCQLYDNGHLASIPDAFTNNFITGYLHATQSARHFWVGGTTTLSSNASWTWSDGADFKYNSWEFGKFMCIIQENGFSCQYTDFL